MLSGLVENPITCGTLGKEKNGRAPKGMVDKRAEK